MRALETLTVFPDTNILLHYPPLVDIDWSGVCSNRSVRLVLCMQVIHELDAKKDHPSLGDRAARTIRDIKSIRENGGAVRPNVTLEVFNEEYRSNDMCAGLSPDCGDDRILHSIKQFVAKTGEKNVAVCSEDVGMSLRCEGQRIRCIEPNKTLRLENPATEKDRKYKEAMTELNRLRSQAPSLVVSALACDAGEDQERKPLETSLGRDVPQDDVEHAVEQEREALQLRKPRPDKMLPGRAKDLVSSMASMKMVSTSALQEYEQEVKAYLVRFREWVEAGNRFRKQAALIFRFHLELRNVGTCPASDIEIELQLPPKLTFVACESESRGTVPDCPQKPERPRKPRSLLETMSSGPSPFDDLLRSRHLQLPNITPRGAACFSLDGDAEVGFVIRLHVPKLVNHRRELFKDFYAMFRSWGDASSFDVLVSQTADNLPERVAYKFPIIVTVTD